MTRPADLRGIAEVAPLIKSRALSPVDLVHSCLARIDAGSAGNAFITVLGDAAVDEARQAEADIAVGRYRGPLHGVPVSIKDLVDVAGTPTTSGSAVPPRRAAVDAGIVARLRAAGAIVIGKTNLHEFAFGTTSDESAFGPVRHPKDPERSAGGSSGGAAVALAEGMCFGSVGTDTGGSIRIPSAACGTVGLKPTIGELPCDGIVPLSTTLDHVGPMARTVADTAVLFRAMNGQTGALITPASAKLTFGVPRAYLCDRLDPDVRTALERTRETLARAGHTVVDVTIDHAAWTPDVYLHIVLPEAARFHAPMLETSAEKYSPGIRLRLEMGRYLLAEDYVRAMGLREHLTRAVDRALEGMDALLLPALAIPAPPLGAASVDVDGAKEPTRAIMLRLTQLFNISGHPAVALPAGTTQKGLPVGMQLVGHLRRTERLLEVASAAEPYISGGPGSVGGGTG
jgi:aspartyl-tRNA(Asn)/glutamyl-tRNA(Gln) amidotransferase subunit A